MRSSPLTGRGIAVAATLVGMMAVSALIAAQGTQATPPTAAKQPTKQTGTKDTTKTPATSQTNQVTETFSATTANMERGGKQTLKIDVLRWSAEADRAKVFSQVKEHGTDKLEDTLQGLTTVGYVWTADGSLGYSIHYAERQPLAGGGERIILATDRKLGSWERDGWKVSEQTPAVDYPFTVIELRLNAKGIGEGKLSLSTKVTADDQTKTIGLDNYASAPVLLQGVKRTRGTERSAS